MKLIQNGVNAHIMVGEVIPSRRNKNNILNINLKEDLSIKYWRPNNRKL